MEIAGYPHYENVASNILAFFLNPRNNHELQALVFESLLVAVGETSFGPDLEINNVVREWRTESGKFLDLLVETPSLAVGIENKIFAQVCNDLGEYAESVRAKAGDGKRPVLVLLALQSPGAGISLAGFKPVTYQELFDRLLQGLGPRLPNANDRCVGYLLEFVRTIQNLVRRPGVSTTFREFVKRNVVGLAGLQTELERLRKEMSDRIVGLSKQVQLMPGPHLYDVLGPGSYNEEWLERFALARYFEIVIPIGPDADREAIARAKYGVEFDALPPAKKAWVTMDMQKAATKLAVDVWLTPSDWSVVAFRRPDSDISDLLKAKNISSTPYEAYPNRRLCYAFPYGADLGEVAAKVQSVIDALRHRG